VIFPRIADSVLLWWGEEMMGFAFFSPRILE